MIAIVTGNIAGASVGHWIELPGSLAVVSRVDIHDARIEINQVSPLAAMRIMAGITSRKCMKLVQILNTVPEHGRAGRVGPIAIGIILVALETKLAGIMDRRAAAWCAAP